MSQGVHSGDFHLFLVGSSFRELIMAGSATTHVAEVEGEANAGQIIVSEDTARALPSKNLGAKKTTGRLLRGDLLPLEASAQTVYEVEDDLTPFIPSALRDLIASDAVVSEHRPATAAFIRFSGVDELLDKNPETVTEVFEELIDDVEVATEPRHIAVLNTDVYPDGLKILLSAGAPTTTGEDEENMLLALREIVSKKRPLPLHIGVARGPVFAADVGTTFRRGYTVMGDQVNLAARLMSRAAPNQVLATDAVLQGSRTIFGTTELEPFMVKGKSKPITAYAVSDALGARVDTSGQDSPLMGRDDEMETLAGLWDRTKEGFGSLVLVGGDRGTGKSRLVGEFAATLDEADTYAAVARRYRSSTPYFAATLLLADILGIDRYHPEGQRGRLTAIVEEAAPELKPYQSLIGTALGLDIPESQTELALAQEYRKARLEESIVALLSAILSEPTLLWVDDSQWVDDASADLLKALAIASADRPWLLVVSGRKVERAAEARDVTAPTITLGPLSADDATAIVHACTDEAPLAPHVTAAIVDRAQGNPMFLHQLLASMGEGDIDAMPESIEGVIAARIDGLLPEDRNALRQLSVLGTAFRPEFSGVVLSDQASPAVLKRLSAFLDVEPTWVKFSNSLVHQAAYGGLPYKLRRDLHGRVAESIERSQGDADLLSVHYHAAGRWPEAWRYSRIAGDHAREIYANLEAASFYERALESVRYVAGVDDSDRIQVLTALGDVRELSGSFDKALDAYRKASRLVGDDSVTRADLHLKRARARLRVGSYSAALRETTSGYRAVEGRDDREAGEAKARLAAFAAAIRLQQGELRKALELAQQAMEQAQLCDERDALAKAYVVLDRAYELLGEPERAVYSAQAREIYEENGDLMHLAVVENNLGLRAYDEGRWDDAIESYTRAREAVRRIGNLQHAASAGANIGEVLVSQRRFDEARAILTEAIRDLRAYKLIELLGFAEIQLARLEMELGNLDEAVALLDQIYRDAATGGRNDDALEAAIYLSDALVRSGQPERALQTLEEAEARAGEEALFYEASLLRVRAEALARLGSAEQALALTEQGLAVARENGLLYEEALLLRTEGEVSQLAGAGDGTEAVEEAGRLLPRLGVTQVV
ncbi:MAG: tetratricopeptide repeat protein [Actinobacteria bacterium]|nr:tetratricopeptide repeat protein [Actinomycetota bacterium]